MEHFTLVDPLGDEDLYVRLSKLKDDKLADCGLQVRRLTEDAEKRGKRVRAVFADDGRSAWDEETEARRPGFLALLRSMKDGHTARVSAVEMSRYSRRVRTADAFMVASQKYGVQVRAGFADLDHTPMSRAMAQVGSAFDEFESAIKSERIKAAHDELARQGKFHGGHRPFGYEADGMTPHETEAPLYRELIERVANGETPGSVALDWKARKILNRSGKPYNGAGLGGLVQSPRHAGLRVFHGEVIGEGVWEGLVTPAQQARAIAAMLSRGGGRRVVKASNAPDKHHEPLLQMMCVCGLCKAPLYLGRSSSRHSRYNCTAAGCGGVAIRVVNTDEEIVEQFLYRITRPETRRKLAKAASAAVEVTNVLGRIDKLNAHAEMLKDMLSHDEIEPGDYRSQMRGLTEQRRAAEKELGEASVPAVLTTDPDTLAEKWIDLTADEKRANLAALIEFVVVDPHLGGSRKIYQPQRLHPRWKA